MSESRHGNLALVLGSQGLDRIFAKTWLEPFGWLDHVTFRSGVMDDSECGSVSASAGARQYVPFFVTRSKGSRLLLYSDLKSSHTKLDLSLGMTSESPFAEFLLSLEGNV